VSLERFPIVKGISPLRELWDKSRPVSLERFPIVKGISPLREL